MAMAPPTMAVPSGRLKEAFDMMELQTSAGRDVGRRRPSSSETATDKKKAAQESCAFAQPAPETGRAQITRRAGSGGDGFERP